MMLLLLCAVASAFQLPRRAGVAARRSAAMRVSPYDGYDEEVAARKASRDSLDARAQRLKRMVVARVH